MGDTANLRNEDFRKLLSSTVKKRETTRDGGETAHSFTHRHQPKTEKKKGGGGHRHHKKEKTEEEDDEANLKEILKNYRDRAAERRTNVNEDADEAAKLSAAYRAVPGDARAVFDKANLRKQAIEESKYLGGDMEHTHLVKGLDYSLLNKVRSELVKSQEADIADQLEEAYNKTETIEAVEKASENKMVRAMNRILFSTELPARNELFGKGRMAYIVDMEEEENDVPTTLLRSLHDCPRAESNANINANNMLISKLTQVLSYLRSDEKKKKKKEMNDEEASKYQNQSIYDNESEYVPRREKDRNRRDDGDKDRRKEGYFDDRRDDRDRRDHRDNDRMRGRDRRNDRDRDRERERERDRERDRERREREEKEKETRLQEKIDKRRKEAEGGGYDECYPGGLAEMGGSWDSDEEDFSKMDIGPAGKKTAIKRWEFDNDDDFEKYQGSREAMPKAAYQFGLKTSDGRKTRKSGDNTKKFDKELNQINQIIEKRKAGGEKDGSYKKPKF